jgi:hypothetical protein
MQKSVSSPAVRTIDHPLCARCGAQMMVARVEPSSPGLDQRTFECKCGRIEMLRVKYK